jgi:hemerythrin
MSVGVEDLDNDHKQWIAIINELDEGIQAGHQREVLESVLKHLLEYTQFHFAREEELFVRTGYTLGGIHAEEHRTLVQRLENLFRHVENRPVAMLDLELMGYIRSWLVNHIQSSDKKYTSWMNSHGIV